MLKCHGLISHGLLAFSIVQIIPGPNVLFRCNRSDTRHTLTT